MKHLMLFLILTVSAYATYHLTPAAPRGRALRWITYHGLRLAALLLIVALVAAAAYYLPSSTLLS